MEMTQTERDLVERNMNLVYSVINENVHGAGSVGFYSYDDLFQIGCIGLCKAAMSNKSDTAKFSTYAYICIRNEVFTALEYATLRKRRELLSDEVGSIEHNLSECQDERIPAPSLSDLYATLDRLKEETSGIMAKGIEAMKLYALGYNYREIGEMMGGVSAKNVTAWVSKARTYLKGQPELLRLREDFI